MSSWILALFSDVAEEIQKEVVSAAATETPAAAMDTAVPQSVHPQEEVSPEYMRDLELTIHKGEEPVQDVSLLETREDLPEGQDPSPSVAAFNKSFGTSHRGELLSVGCEVARNKGGAPRILTLWKSSALIDETGEGGSEQSLHSLGEAAHDSGKEPRPSLKKTSASLGKSSASSGKKVTIQNLSEKGSSLFVNSWASQLYDFLVMTLIMDFFQSLKIFFVHTHRLDLRSTKKIMLLNPPCLERLLLNGLSNKRRSTNIYLMSLKNLNATSILLKLQISTLRRR
jgi:hypothetical protein